MTADGLRSNITAHICPACAKNLRYKPPCCSDKNSYYICPCGYKRVRDEIDSVHNSSGSNDPASLQS